jgi:hypothetical protein
MNDNGYHNDTTKYINITIKWECKGHYYKSKKGSFKALDGSQAPIIPMYCIWGFQYRGNI